MLPEVGVGFKSLQSMSLTYMLYPQLPRAGAPGEREARGSQATWRILFTINVF